MTMKTMEKVSVEVKRGDIFLADLGTGKGSEQSGLRPVICLQNEIGNKYSSTIIVAAISSQMQKKKMPTHVTISAEECQLDRDSFVMLEQIRTIDKQRLVHKVAHIEGEKMDEINNAMLISLGMVAPQPQQKPVERPVTNPATQTQSQPKRSTAPIITDAGKRTAWAEKSKRSNFVAPSIVPLKKEVK